MKALRDLPNVDGFEFVGRFSNADPTVCRVVRDPMTGTHYVERISDRAKVYCWLVAWEPLRGDQEGT